MEKTKALVTVIEMARAGLGFTPADALDHIAALIAQEDAESPFHDRRVEELLRLGACIWSLRRDLVTPR
ncbi:hypothetical protein [Variovorax paradoxus]|jgi:hypothetical protein|uniref:Uncharacterized protein n=1 Tax=Variovorax paradoxus (strain S110) TaxID=543728 RepID=C5D213_VARPS|nr:hypothetical protein [Variovorax paradoxus]MBW8718524.1 hypothetical protein [Variovorax paradoxus]